MRPITGGIRAKEKEASLFFLRISVGRDFTTRKSRPTAELVYARLCGPYRRSQRDRVSTLSLEEGRGL